MTAPDATERAIQADIKAVASLLKSLTQVQLDGESPDPEVEDEDFYMENDDTNDTLTAFVQDARSILKTSAVSEAVERLADEIVTVPGSFAWWDALLAGDQAARWELRAFIAGARKNRRES